MLKERTKRTLKRREEKKSGPEPRPTTPHPAQRRIATKAAATLAAVLNAVLHA